jgi:hypothetical protein
LQSNDAKFIHSIVLANGKELTIKEAAFISLYKYISPEELNALRH